MTKATPPNQSYNTNLCPIQTQTIHQNVEVNNHEHNYKKGKSGSALEIRTPKFEHRWSFFPKSTLKETEKTLEDVLTSLEDLAGKIPSREYEEHREVYEDLADQVADLKQLNAWEMIRSWPEINSCSRGLVMLTSDIRRTSIRERARALPRLENQQVDVPTSREPQPPSHQTNGGISASSSDPSACCQCNLISKNPALHCRPSDMPPLAEDSIWGACFHTVTWFGRTSKAICVKYCQPQSLVRSASVDHIQ